MPKLTVVPQLMENALAEVNPRYKLVSYAVLNDHEGVILVDRTDGAPPFPQAPFVTWGFSCFEDTLPCIHTGHYDMSEEAAIEDFNKRVERGF